MTLPHDRSDALVALLMSTAMSALLLAPSPARAGNGSGTSTSAETAVRAATRPASEATTHPAGQPTASFRRLFNGRNLEGFYTYLRGRGRDDDPKNVFTVADGLIRVSGQEWGCITTHEAFEDYLLVVEFKWGEKTWPPRVDRARDSGILLHSVGRDGAYSGVWMHSIEVQLIEGGTGDLLVVGDGSDRYAISAPVSREKVENAHVFDPNGELITITTGRIDWFGRDPQWKDAIGFRGRQDVERPHGEWNHLECRALGDTIEVRLNNVLVSRCIHVKPSRGRIQIQSEGAEVFFRRIVLVELRPASLPAEP